MKTRHLDLFTLLFILTLSLPIFAAEESCALVDSILALNHGHKNEFLMLKEYTDGKIDLPLKEESPDPVIKMMRESDKDFAYSLPPEAYALENFVDLKTGKLLQNLPQGVVLSAENGSAPLKAVRIHWSNVAIHEGEVLIDYVKALKHFPNLEIILINDGSDPQLLNELLKSFTPKERARIKILNSEKQIIFWTQDGSKAYGVGKKSLMRKGGYSNNYQPHAYDETLQVPIEVAHAQKVIRKKNSNLHFEGGNVIVGSKHVFLGAQNIENLIKNAGISRTDAYRLFEREFGKPVIEVGYPTSEGIKNQVSFHIDLDMAVAVNLKSHKKEDVIIVQSISDFLEKTLGISGVKDSMSYQDYVKHVKKALAKYVWEADQKKLTKEEVYFLSFIQSVQPEAFVRFEILQRAMIKDLTKKGYEIRTIPGIDDFTENSSELRTYNYTNVILSENKALVPVYGVPSLDEAAFKIYQDLGYEVIPMKSSRYTLCYQGGIRCSTETYRGKTK